MSRQPRAPRLSQGQLRALVTLFENHPSSFVMTIDSFVWKPCPPGPARGPARTIRDNVVVPLLKAGLVRVRVRTRQRSLGRDYLMLTAAGLRRAIDLYRINRLPLTEAT